MAKLGIRFQSNAPLRSIIVRSINKKIDLRQETRKI